jgi:hypothetical protein
MSLSSQPSPTTPSQRLNLIWTRYPRSMIVWGLFGTQRWLLWTLNTPPRVKHARPSHRILCKMS